MKKSVSDPTKANQIISDFLHVTSHQLLTPLTISLWYSQLLQSRLTAEGNNNYNGLLEEVLNANYRMREIVNLMLDTSRIESNRYKLKSNKIQLRNLIASKLSKTKQEFAGFEVTSGINNLLHTDPVIYSDKTILGRVIELIIHNCLKYNRNNPRSVSIGLRKAKEGKILLTFTDNGIGIPKSEQKHIFNKFYRARNASALEPEGNGLGLYYARKSLQLLGGDIWFRSGSHGTVFTIKLDLAKKSTLS